jgi:DNA-binding NarL/FixJ family response regulator
VARPVVQPLSDDEIADRPHIGERTVRTYINHMLCG